MERLFQFLYRYRAFILFVILEYTAFQMIRSRTVYQQTKIIKTSKEVTGRINKISGGVFDFFNLRKSNRELREENARLRNLLARKGKTSGGGLRSDLPPSVIQQYYYIHAEVINNTTNRFNNYLTINKGKLHGVEKDMAVVGSYGIIGKVESVSTNFATVISILHTGFYIASKIEPSGIQSTLKWDAQSSNISSLLYVPRHLTINQGDTVKTSGYNSIFPPDISIGLIRDVELKEDASFYDLNVRLFTNFSSLQNVYIVGNRLKEERTTLEEPLKEDND